MVEAKNVTLQRAWGTEVKREGALAVSKSVPSLFKSSSLSTRSVSNETCLLINTPGCFTLRSSGFLCHILELIFALGSSQADNSIHVVNAIFATEAGKEIPQGEGDLKSWMFQLHTRIIGTHNSHRTHKDNPSPGLFGCFRATTLNHF